MHLSRRHLAAALLAGALSTGLAGCSNASSLESSSTTTSSERAGTITIGSANFPESVIIAHIYGGALTAQGYTVRYRDNIGARDAYLAALKDGEIDLVPEYAGALLNTLDDAATATTSTAVKEEIDAKIGSLNAVALDLADAADSDSITVTRAYATKHGLESIGDLRKVGTFTLAANPEFGTRPDGIAGLRDRYGITEVRLRAINDGGGNLTLTRLLTGDVQAADIYTTSPSIADNDLVVLDDPESLFASQQVLPVLRTAKQSPAVTKTLNAVSARLTTSDLLNLNREVTGASKTDAADAAASWLANKTF